MYQQRNSKTKFFYGYQQIAEDKCENWSGSPHIIYMQYSQWVGGTQHMNQAVHTFNVWAPPTDRMKELTYLTSSDGTMLV